MTFWVAVRDFQRGKGPGPYTSLAEKVLSFLTIAHSTASVERIFSHVSFIKTKFRNRMKTKTLESLLVLRNYLCKRKLCCSSFMVTESMLEKMNTSMYKSIDNKGEDVDDLVDNVLHLLPDGLCKFLALKWIFYDSSLEFAGEHMEKFKLYMYALFRIWKFLSRITEWKLKYYSNFLYH